MTNVILIVCDALRPANLREYGYHKDTTPFITELCESATVYRNAYAHMNYTTPSIATILTGEYHQKTGIWRLVYPVHEESKDGSYDIFAPKEDYKWKLHPPTIAEKLNKTHRTIMINEVFVDLSDRGGIIWKDFDKAPSNYSGQKGNTIHRISAIPVHPSAEQTTDAALNEIWEAMDAKEEFFAYVHYWDTHWPPSAPKEYIEKFYSGSKFESVNRWYSDFSLPEVRQMIREQVAARTESRDLNYLKAWYDAAIYYIDENIRRLLEDIPDDTLVIITSDHGEAMGEHNNVFFGHLESWLYEEVLKVPLIVHYPVESGKCYRRTIYDRVENRKIFNIIENYVIKGGNDDPIKSDYIYSACRASDRITPHLDAIIMDDLKIYAFDFGDETYGYNLKDDPNETNPLLLQDRHEFDKAKKLLKELMYMEAAKPEGAV